MKHILWCLAALMIAPAAQADWQYTRWGMTPEQVVAASGGTSELLPVAQRPRVPPLVTAATGEATDGRMQLRTVFSFGIEGNGLQCVTYGVRSHADDDAFRAALIQRYGQPQDTGGIALLGMTNLGWKTATDEINATFSTDDPAFAMQCRRG